MSEKPSEPSDDRDNVHRIYDLVRMMRKFDLSAIDLVEGSTSIRLRRRGANVPGLAPSAISPAVPLATAPIAPPPQAVPPAQAPPTPEPPRGVLIESPMVGTFYQSSSPENPAFVTLGSAVRPETTVCIIEAMKVFTEIPAGVSGTVVELLVKDKQPVEFGQPLFRVEPS